MSKIASIKVWRKLIKLLRSRGCSRRTKRRKKSSKQEIITSEKQQPDIPPPLGGGLVSKEPPDEIIAFDRIVCSKHTMPSVPYSSFQSRLLGACFSPLYISSMMTGEEEPDHVSIGDTIPGRAPDPSDIVEFDSVMVGDRTIFLCPGDRQEAANKAIKEKPIKIEIPPPHIVYKGQKLYLTQPPVPAPKYKMSKAAIEARTKTRRENMLKGTTNAERLKANRRKYRLSRLHKLQSDKEFDDARWAAWVAKRTTKNPGEECAGGFAGRAGSCRLPRWC